MVLGFSTQVDEKPTYFVEKIWQSFPDEFTIDNFDDFEWDDNYTFHDDAVQFIAKVHTIRRDKNNLWKKGRIIDFFINVRKKTMFRFAPVLPVVSTQNFQVVWYDRTDTVWEFPHLKYAVRVDKRRLEPKEIETLAQNDGFDSVEDFLHYFNEDFKGKIIHWTDLKY